MSLIYLSCFYAPAVIVRLVLNAGNKGNNIIACILQIRDIVNRDLFDAVYLVLSCTELCSELNSRAEVKLVNIFKIRTRSAVMRSETNIAVPNGGIFKMTYALRED